MSKKVEKEQAMALRKRGFSFKEIAKYTNVSVSTVSLWLRDETWSKQITEQNQKRAARENGKRISLLNKARNNQNERLYSAALRSAITEFKHYQTNPLFIAGITSYVALGDRTNAKLIRLSTANSEIQRVFIRFAQEFLGVPRETIRFWLLLYPWHNDTECRAYWAAKLKIKEGQFHKSQAIQGKSTKHALHKGIGNTIIGSTVLKMKLTKWIELTLKKL
jgi:transcriptional regulator with XRE-family HTH domain